MKTFTLQFPDRMVSYDTFIRDLSASIVKQIKDAKDDPDTMSQREAYRIFGRANVERWVKKGQIEGHKRPGKVEYFTAELRRLQARTQDYFG